MMFNTHIKTIYGCVRVEASRTVAHGTKKALSEHTDIPLEKINKKETLDLEPLKLIYRIGPNVIIMDTIEGIVYDMDPTINIHRDLEELTIYRNPQRPGPYPLLIPDLKDQRIPRKYYLIAPKDPLATKKIELENGYMVKQIEDSGPLDNREA